MLHNRVLDQGSKVVIYKLARYCSNIDYANFYVVPMLDLKVFDLGYY